MSKKINLLLLFLQVLLSEAILADRTDIVNLDITNGGLASDAGRAD